MNHRLLRLQAQFLTCIHVFVAITLSMAVPTATHAQVDFEQNGVPKVEWQKQLEVGGHLGALDMSLMGDTIDLHTGTLSFTHTDISLPGNFALPVELKRRRTQGQLNHATVDAGFGDWALVTPRVEAIVGPNSEWRGGGARCSGYDSDNFPQERVNIPSKTFGNPDEGGTRIPGSAKYYEGHHYSNGISVTSIGGSNEAVLRAYSDTDYHKPSDAKFTTASGWYFTCIELGSNEGFVGHSPDGTTYTFDTVVVREAKELEFFDHDPDNTNLDRFRVSLMASRVEDVNGNWVDYDYDSGGRLNGISASDGRSITLSHSGDLITSATANGRTWSYAYGVNGYKHRYWEGETVDGPENQVLRTATLPDSTKWEFNLDEMTAGPAPGERCVDNPKIVHIVHPHGMNALYFLRDTDHRTSLDARTFSHGWCGPYTLGLRNSFPECEISCGGNDPGNQIQRLKLMPTVSVMTKRLYVPDSPDDDSQWTYSYGTTGAEDEGGSYPPYLYRSNVTKVVDPKGHETTYFHRWHRERDGGAMLRREVRSEPGGTLMEAEETTYVHPVSNGQQTDNSIRAGLAVPYSGYFEDDIDTRDCMGVNVTTNSQHFFANCDYDALDFLTAPPGVMMYPSQKVVTRNGDTYTTTYTYNKDRKDADYSFGKAIAEAMDTTVPSSNHQSQTEYQHLRSEWVIGLPTSMSREGVTVSETTYDDLGRVTEEYAFGLKTRGFTYHDGVGSAGAIHTVTQDVTDTQTRTLTLEEWKAGVPQLLTFEDGTTYRQTVDDNGWVTRTEDQLGHASDYAYDAMGRMTSFTPPQYSGTRNPTTIAYDLSGPTVQTVTRGNAVSTITYDALLRPVLEQTTNGATQESSYVNTAYDIFGNVTFRSHPSASSTDTNGIESEYDALNRVTVQRETSRPGAAITHEYRVQNRHRVVDAEGNATDTYRYGWKGPGDAPSRAIYRYGGQAGLERTHTDRDVFGKLVRVRRMPLDGSLRVEERFFYDGHQRLCRHETMEGGSTLYAYNGLGEVMSYSKGMPNAHGCATPSGDTRVDITRNDMGRITAVAYDDPDTPDVSATYTARGRLKTLAKGNLSNAYWYTATGLPYVEDLNIDGMRLRTRRYFNADDAEYAREYPSGELIYFTRDGLGRATAVREYDISTFTFSDLMHSAAFHPGGQVASASYGNGQVLTRTLDARQLTSRLTVSSPNQLALDLGYAYDDRAKVSAITDHRDPAQSRQFGYDGLGQLVLAEGPHYWGSGRYTYDVRGNLVRKVMGRRVRTMGYDGLNRLVSVDSSAGSEPTRTLSYDSRGNVARYGDMTFAYGLDDRMIRANSGMAGVPNSTYTYDGHGRRAKSVVGGETHYSVYLSDGELVHKREVDAAGNLVSESDLVRANGALVVEFVDGVPEYTHTDHLGTVSTRTDASGLLTQQEYYTPYGEPMGWQRPGEQELGFTGHLKDKTTGLTYMQARHYDPVSGRFLSTDPLGFASIGDPRFINRYSYAGNDPVNNLDPDGRQVVCGACRYMKPMSERRKREIVDTAVETHLKVTVGLALAASPVDEVSVTVGAVAKGAQALKGAKAVKTIKIDSSKSPEAAQHIRDAGYDGATLTVDRSGTSTRRAEALNGTPTRPGMDRDEVPPAVFQEGGAGASVRHIDSSDNRSAGGQLGQQLKDVPDGSCVRLECD